MSRAFVNDDAPDASLDEAPELKIPIPPKSRNYLTPEGSAALVAELSLLETETLPGLLADIERLDKLGGDHDGLSNLRYAFARTNRRMQYLSRMSVLAETIERPENGYERVAFGALVTVRDDSGIETAYRVVGVDEADPEHGLLAWLSPIAKALMGKKPGDTVTIQLPESVIKLTVVSVE